MHTLFCYYCLFCPSSIQLCALYYSDLKMTEELSKHIFKKCRYISASIRCFALVHYMYQSKSLYKNFKSHFAWHHRSLCKRYQNLFHIKF